MRGRTIGMAAAAIGALLVGAPAAGNAATGWQRQDLPNVDSEHMLTDTAALGANDVWAIGPTYGGDPTVLLHWDGTSWTRNAGPGQDDFAGSSISGVSGSDVWAAGHCTFAPQTSETPCATHWNGSAWSTPVRLPPPDIGTTVTVDAVAAHDVWVAGGQTNSAYYAHFDGATWSRVAAPAGAGEYITDLAATGPKDVWAAGYRVGNSGDAADRPVVQHWDGTRWTRFTTPDVAGRLSQIAPIDGTRVWAVGNGTGHTLVLRRSGTGFYQAPAVPGTDTFATGVAPDGTGGAWIALTPAFPDGAGSAQTSTTHYAHFANGAWTLANGGTYSGQIRSWTLTRVPGTTSSLYAVGTDDTDAGPVGYVESSTG
ncbi:MAG TPA: hypothetical protein VGL93_33875 [Streptosporangiaceae bacterium]|jgi:hypothetical protein